MITLRLLLAFAVLTPVLTAEEAFDWNRAKAIFQRANNGETLAADEQKYLDEAKRRHAAGESPDKPASPDANKPAIDWNRAKDLFQREQRGEKLSAEAGCVPPPTRYMPSKSSKRLLGRRCSI